MGRQRDGGGGWMVATGSKVRQDLADDFRARTKSYIRVFNWGSETFPITGIWKNTTFQ